MSNLKIMIIILLLAICPVYEEKGSRKQKSLNRKERRMK